MGKTLIIYYSRRGENYVNGSIVNLEKGNTEIVAEYLKEATGGELFEIRTVKEYDKDYTRCTEEAKAELRENARPELREYLDSVEEYDNIIVASPCWWGTVVPGMFTQLERLDFSGKNVFSVMTHEGSGLGKSVEDLKKTCKGASVGTGLAIHGADAKKSKQAVADWVKKNIV